MVHVAVVWILGTWGTPSLSMGTWGSPRAMGGPHMLFIQASPPGEKDITTASQRQKIEAPPRPHRERQTWVKSWSPS